MFKMGKSMPIIPNEIYGWVDNIATVNDRYYFLNGWAADVKNSRLVDEILIFVDKKFVKSAQTSKNRLDIAKTLNKEHLVKIGYGFSLTSNIFNQDSDIRIIAVSNGRASELSYKEKSEYFLKLSDLNDKR